MLARSTLGRFAIFAAFVLVACRGESREQQAAAVASGQPSLSMSSVATGARPPGPRAVTPGESPFNYPTVSTTAKAGDYVLAPSKSFIDEAFARGGEKQ